MTGEETTYRCRASTASGERCSFRGTREQLAEHADEVGHARCIIGAETLNEHERQTCQRCANRVRDDLDAIAVAYAHLERVIAASAYRTPKLPGGDALVYAADGSTQGGGPDEWLTDPIPVIAILEANERDWRHEFGHGPAVDIATVAGCLTYLRTWHTLAARTHPGFDDYAGEISALRNRIEHVVGMADDPIRPGVPCFDCSGQLLRSYEAPVGYAPTTEHDCQVCGRHHAGRHGTKAEGLADVWVCRSCSREYGAAEYYLAVRNKLEEQAKLEAS